MKKGIMRMRKSVPLTLLALVLSIVMVSVGTVSPIPTITQANPTTIVYLDPPTITGVTIGEEFTVNIMIRNAHNIYAWQAGLTFNATLLECTGFDEGEFLEEDAGPMGTGWIKGTIDNTAGTVWPPYMCTLKGDYWARGSGRLAYATFKVNASGVSDIHLSEVKVLDYPDLILVPVNIIDVYTVVLDTTPHTVVTVSNSTDTTGASPGSGLHGHAFNPTLKELSFKVTGPHPGFSNVMIPTSLLLPPEPPYTWAIIVDGTSLSVEKITVTENLTHSSIYFTYSEGLHNVQITTRFMLSTISIAISEESISLGESVTISGAIDPVRPDVTVTIHNRTEGDEEWDTIDTVKTDQNSEYTYTWTPGEPGTYEVMASWEGDLELGILRDESEVKTLEVKGKPGIPLEVVAVVVVAIIIIAAAIVVYFVRFRKT